MCGLFYVIHCTFRTNTNFFRSHTVNVICNKYEMSKCMWNYMYRSLCLLQVTQINVVDLLAHVFLAHSLLIVFYFTSKIFWYLWGNFDNECLARMIYSNASPTYFKQKTWWHVSPLRGGSTLNCSIDCGWESLHNYSRQRALM